MKPTNDLTIIGIGLLLAGLLGILALAAWWLWSGYWLAISMVDAIGLVSPSTAAMATTTLSSIDILYFVFAEAPLYSLLLVVGAVLFVIGKTKSNSNSEKTVSE
jgi:hypothetical protein